MKKASISKLLKLNVGTVGDQKSAINLKRQKIVENYEILNKLKQEWDSLSAQHHNLSQRYIPNNIEVGLNKLLLV